MTSPVKVIGAAAVPDFVMLTCSGYVPVAMCTVWPGSEASAAAWTVQNGWSCSPVPAFEQWAAAALST